MTTFTHYLGDDHTHCDDLFAAAENAVAEKHWDDARTQFQTFHAAMRRHFAMEEDVLFPAFEARTGMVGGPTYIMRGEHEQMLGLMDNMRAALAREDYHAYMSLSETLLMLMRQHNMKEENILYPMADQALAAERDGLLATMSGLEHTQQA